MERLGCHGHSLVTALDRGRPTRDGQSGLRGFGESHGSGQDGWPGCGLALEDVSINEYMRRDNIEADVEFHV